MPISIQDLSAEVLLHIVDILVANAEDDEEDEYDDPKKNKYDQYVNFEPEQISFTALDPEKRKPVINLSATCSRFRNLIGPQIYRKLHLTNKKAIAESVRAVGTGPFRDNVKEVLFVGTAPATEDEKFHDVEDILPAEVQYVLENLTVFFPNLESLAIAFAFDIIDPDRWEMRVWKHFQNHSNEGLQALEDKEAYRALVAKLWTAVSHNVSQSRRGIKSLKLPCFMPFPSTVYSLPILRNFLGTIEKFEISVWAPDRHCGFWGHIGRSDRNPIPKLDHIFSALKSCTDFTLEVSKVHWLALKGFGDPRLGISPGQMPLLKRLTLRWLLATNELVTFLKDHSNTLEEIVFEHCAASSDSLITDRIDWHELFESMQSLSNLKSVRVLPQNVFSEYEPIHLSESELQERSQRLKNIQEDALVSGGQRRAFEYMRVYRRAGEWRKHEEQILRKYREGEDQKAWVTLLDMVERNRNKIR